jgi:hypothetical protein
MGAITPEERAAVRARSPIGTKYDTSVNRESAYEILSKRTAGSASAAPASRESASPPAPRGEDAAPAPGRERAQPAPSSDATGGLSDLLWGTKRRQGMVEAMAKQAARSVGGEVGRQILRGVLGGILGGARRR